MATDDVRRPGAKGLPTGPQAIGRIMSRLLARTGYDREQASESLAAHCRPGRIRRGVLEVFVSHSAVSQEFSFHKPAVLERLKAALPAAAISDIRCRLADAPAGP